MKIFIQEVQIWWYQPSLKAITMRQRGHKPKSLAQSIWKQVSYKLPANAVVSIIAQKPPPLFKHSLDLREAQIGFLIQDQLVVLIKPSAKIYCVLNFLKLSPAFDWIQIS